MTRTKHTPSEGLAIYDPRNNDRIFKLSNSEIWHSRGTELLFFETDDRSRFTNGRWLITLVDLLRDETQPSEIELCVEPSPKCANPKWISDAVSDDKRLLGKLRPHALDDLRSFYDAYAMYGRWVFRGLRSPGQMRSNTAYLPDILTSPESLAFYVEIDLDGMLIGFVRLSPATEGVIDKLAAL